MIIAIDLCTIYIIWFQALNGTFLIVYTSAPAVNCHRVKYKTDSNNVITGQIESWGCCVKTDNFSFTSNKLDYDVGPIPGYTSSCPSLVTEKGSMKLLATTGSGESLCLIVAVCQPDYYGINLSCRSSTSTPLLLELIILLFNLLGSLGLRLALALQPVSQTNCFYPSNNCPSF